MKKIVLILLFISVNYVFSQVTLEWVKYNSGPAGSSTFYQIIKTDPAGNSYISGSYIDGNQFKGFSLKYSTSGAAGTTYWTANQMQPTCFWIDNNFNVYSGGYFNQSPIRYLDVYKCLPQGIAWESIDSLYGYGGNEALDITCDNEGNTYLLRFEGIYFIYRYSITGACTKYPLTGVPEAARIAVDQRTNDLYLASYKNDFGREGHLSKYDTDFNKKWETTFGVIGDVINLICLPDGSILTFDNIFGVKKFSPDGVYLWNGGTPGFKRDVASNTVYSLVTGDSGTYKIFNSSGNITKISSTRGNKVCSDKNNDVYVTSTNNSKARISKVTSNLSYKWDYDFEATAGAFDSIYWITTDSNCNIFAAGSEQSASGTRGLVFKLRPCDDSISGYVTYTETNNPVYNGYVRALKYNPVSREITIVAQAQFNAGQYCLRNCPKDSLFIMAFSGSNGYDYVPTYYDSVINWQRAVLIYPPSVHNNLNFKVHKQPESTHLFLSGRILLSNISEQPVKDAYIYAKKDGEFKGFSYSTAGGQYSVNTLLPGTYEIIADRIGFYPVYTTVTIQESNVYNFDIYMETVVNAKPLQNNIPSSFVLYQNYPNPFNPATSIKFDIPKTSHVKIVIYDISGKQAAVLADDIMKAGTYSVYWNASNYSSGVYFYVLSSEKYYESRKMVLVK